MKDMAGESETDEGLPQLKDDYSTLKDLPTERLPSNHQIANKKPSHERLTHLIAETLGRVNGGDTTAYFELGQLYFEQGDYENARKYFQEISSTDYEARYQLAIMAYDGLGQNEDQKSGVELLKSLALGPANLVPRSLAHAAEYNIGRACYQGYGVPQSTEQALRWWVLAADDGSAKGSVIAQTTLGYYFSQPDSRDLKKAFFWHTEATGNGSVESQGCLGIMYLHGLGVKKNEDLAFHVLKEAAERGNVYAMGNLVSLYYRKKLFTKATELATKVLAIENVDQAAEESCCMKAFVSKGIAIASFIYGRCLHKGLALKQDADEAIKFYSKSYHCDADVCAQMQDFSNRGLI